MKEHNFLKKKKMKLLEIQAREPKKLSFKMEKAESLRRLSGTTTAAINVLQSARITLKKNKNRHARGNTLCI